MFANSQALWKHTQSDHPERLPYGDDEAESALNTTTSLPYGDDEAESAQNTITSSPRDHMDQAWQYERNSNPFNSYHNFPMMNNMSMMMFSTPTQTQEGSPFVGGGDKSRDYQKSTSHLSLANHGQSFSPSLDHAGCLDLTSHTNYEAADASFLNGVSSAFAFPSSPDPVDLAASMQWTQDMGSGESLLHVIPQQSLHEARYQYPPGTPAMQSAIPDFQREQDLATEGFDEPRTIQFQHAQSQQEAPNTCQECKSQFRNKARLDSHARQTQHATYACSCGETFSRFDVLNRHLDKFDPKAVYSCPYCSKYSDHRPDHLTQHLRGYHKLDVSDDSQDSQPSPSKATSKKKARTCPHEGCAYHSPTTGPSSESDENQQQIVFQMRKELTQHLRDAHDESPFPCTAPGCRRVGRKGFCRRRDLLKHQKTHNRESTSNSS